MDSPPAINAIQEPGTLRHKLVRYKDMPDLWGRKAPAECTIDKQQAYSL